MLPPHIQVSPGRLTMQNINLRSCVMWAWDLRDYQVTLPFSSQTYEIAATAGRPVQEGDLRMMLRSLLNDRFHMKAHMEKQDRAVLQLVSAKNGPKFRSTSASGGGIEHKRNMLPGGGYTELFRNAPVEALTGILSFHMFSPVVDKTGLAGRYDFDLVAPPLNHGSPDELAQAWRDAIEKQLGLTTRTGKSPVDVLVVDHIDDVPTPN